MKKNKALLTFILALTLSSCVPEDKAGSSFASSSQSQPAISMSSAATTIEQSSESCYSSGASLSSEQSSSEASCSSQEASSSFISSNLSSSVSNDSLGSLSSPSIVNGSSERSSLSSSDDKEYCNVSIYQYYPVANFGHKQGEIRFDLIIQVEQGLPLYSSVEEHRAIERRLSPDYWPQGDGYYYCMSFFTDAECTKYYRSGTPILSDTPLYYYYGG